MRFAVIAACLFSFLCQASSLYAAQGQQELSTRYPSPYGEYNKLSANELSATTVQLGGSPLPAYDGTVTFEAQNALVDATGKQGELAYYKDPTDTTIKGFRYHDGSEWKKISQSSGEPLGAWEITGYAKNTVYQAPKDGFVLAFVYVDPDGGYLDGYTNSTGIFSDPSGVPGSGADRPAGLVARRGHPSNYLNDYRSIMFPVRKGDYWLIRFWRYEGSWVQRTAYPRIRWIPLE